MISLYKFSTLSNDLSVKDFFYVKLKDSIHIKAKEPLHFLGIQCVSTTVRKGAKNHCMKFKYFGIPFNGIVYNSLFIDREGLFNIIKNASCDNYKKLQLAKYFDFINVKHFHFKIKNSTLDYCEIPINEMHVEMLIVIDQHIFSFNMLSPQDEVKDSVFLDTGHAIFTPVEESVITDIPSIAAALPNIKTIVNNTKLRLDFLRCMKLKIREMSVFSSLMSPLNYLIERLVLNLKNLEIIIVRIVDWCKQARVEGPFLQGTAPTKSDRSYDRSTPGPSFTTSPSMLESPGPSFTTSPSMLESPSSSPTKLKSPGPSMLDNPSSSPTSPDPSFTILDNPSSSPTSPDPSFTILDNPSSSPTKLKSPGSSMLENPASMLENPASMLENPSSSMLENPASMLENPASMLENPSSSPMLKNPGSSPMLKNPSFSPRMLENPSFSPSMLENPGSSPMLKNPSFSPMLENPSFSPMLENPGSSPMLKNPSFSMLENPGSSPMLKNPSFSMLENPGSSPMLENPGSSPMLKNSGSSPMLENPGSSPMLKNPSSSPMLENPSFSPSMLENPSFRMLENPSPRMLENPSPRMLESQSSTKLKGPNFTMLENPGPSRYTLERRNSILTKLKSPSPCRSTLDKPEEVGPSPMFEEDLQLSPKYSSFLESCLVKNICSYDCKFKRRKVANEFDDIIQRMRKIRKEITEY